MKRTRTPSDQTLQEYLDSLLRPAPQPSAPTPIVALPAGQPALSAARPYAEPAARPVVVLPKLAPVEQAPTAPVAVTAPAVAPVVAPAVAPQRPVTALPAAKTAPAAPVAAPARPGTAPSIAAGTPPSGQPAPWAANGRPTWAQGPFESLLFVVGGLNLAVPLAELGTIYTFTEDDVAPLFGQADWFMGLLSNKERKIRVVDTAQVVMPERYRPAMRSQYRYVITLNGTDWGLAVDRVANALPLDPEQVRWRGARSQRAWLAGTVVDHMCALVDPGQLAWSFQQQDRRRRQGGA